MLSGLAYKSYKGKEREGEKWAVVVVGKRTTAGRQTVGQMDRWAHGEMEEEIRHCPMGPGQCPKHRGRQRLSFRVLV